MGKSFEVVSSNEKTLEKEQLNLPDSRAAEDALRQAIIHTGKSSQLKSLRSTTSDIETQITPDNKKVEHWAGGEDQIDV